MNEDQIESQFAARQQSDLKWYAWQKARIAELMKGVLAGNLDQAFKLASVLDHRERGQMVVKLYKSQVPTAAFAEVLKEAWTMNHWSVTQAAGSRTRLIDLFKYAQFELPDSLPQDVEVWRGVGADVSLRTAARGFAWSTSRSVAAWYALRFYASRNGLLLRATVHKSHVLFFDNDRQEEEVVLSEAPKNVNIDGTPADWHRWAAQHAGSVKAKSGVSGATSLGEVVSTTPSRSG